MPGVSKALHWVAALALVPRLVLAAPDLELRMAVDNPAPGPGQPVQFTVTLRNIGLDAAAGVQVQDRLPPELRIPAGQAVFASVGSYDAAAGTWSLDTVAAGASATLVIPAVVVATVQPPCIVNVATTSHSSDPQASNNRAVAAVKRSAEDRCVDLSVTAELPWHGACVTSNRLGATVFVRNAGPDPAGDVFADLAQDPVVAPGLRFTGTGCAGTRCSIASLAPGVTVTLEATSDSFRNAAPQTVRLSFAVSSRETDYATANNQRSVTDQLPAVSLDCDDIDLGEGWGVVGFKCFIATAAFGSPLEPHVVVLRRFRDRHLLRTAPGRAFVRFYYRHSPPVAAVIARHQSLRFAVRVLLTPLVLAIEYPLRAAALALLCVTIIGWRRPARA